MGGTACLISVCVQAVLKASKCDEARRGLETTFFGLRDV
jgi:hypothetical protein